MEIMVKHSQLHQIHLSLSLLNGLIMWNYKL
jgi:hypothetical protein